MIQTRWFLIVMLMLIGASAQAQIYVCRAADGTRVYSDERCGDDAKLVPGITSKKRSTVGSGTASKPVVTLKSAAELEALLTQCDAGTVAACNAWTRGGGPNQLRDKERQIQLACEGGSLVACEERYCSDGANDACRTRVLQAATLKGTDWYVRKEARQPAGAGNRYDVRCIWEGIRGTRDVAISCAAQPGPQRCAAANAAQAYAELSAAASSACSR